MAEMAFLTSAHDHVRQAGSQTRKGDLDAAAAEHIQAATDFNRACRSTSDHEALRMLKLLEAQHERIAHIIRTKNDVLAVDSVAETPTVTTAEIESVKPAPIHPAASNTVKAARPKSAIRESSPSLARDIATRRGIRQSAAPLSAAAQARARQMSPDNNNNNNNNNNNKRSISTPLPRIPASVMEPQSIATSPQATEDGFASFYSNLTTGTMSKLSSVLAYAGLPLAAEVEPPPDKPSQTVKASTDPDVKKIYSKATLSAIEDEHRQRGLQGQVFGPAESFYMVQTSGGTRSYADITKTAQTPVAALGGDDEESFVDAREAQQPPSPRHARQLSKQSRNDFGNPRTNEELELENTTLKQTLEQLASRLANFEAHAQDASMAALTQSMATLHHLSPPPDAAAGQERIKQLEKRIEQQADQREKLEELAKKQERKIRAYHAKWEEIKKNAREKEKSKREKQTTDDDIAPGPS